MRAVRIVVIAVVMVVGVPAARAQNTICANFFAPTTGTYGDHCSVTVSGTTTTGTQFGVTGMLQATAAGTECTTWTTNQILARIDLRVIGVDPGEEVSFVFNGGAYELIAENLIRNPDGATTQPVTLSNGHVISLAADGSGYLEVLGAGIMMSYGVCTTSDGAHGGVVIRNITNAFCQCGNAHKHFNEECDDGDTADGDGCSGVCTLEDGWFCTSVYDEQSVCTMEIPDAAVPDAMPIDASVPDAAPPAPDAEPAPDADPTAPDADTTAPDADTTAPDADTTAPDAPTNPAVDAGEDDLPPLDPANGCGCQGTGDPGSLLLALALFAGLIRRRRA